MKKKRKSRARRRPTAPPVPPRSPRPALACLRCGFGARCIEHGLAPFTKCTIKCVYIPDGTWISRYTDKVPDTCGRCHSHSWRIPWTGHGRRPSDPPNPRWLRAEEASANKRLIRQVAREEALQRIREAEQAEDDAAEREESRQRMLRERGPRAIRSNYVPPVSILRVAPDTRRLNAGLSGLPPPPMIMRAPPTRKEGVGVAAPKIKMYLRPRQVAPKIYGAKPDVEFILLDKCVCGNQRGTAGGVCGNCCMAILSLEEQKVEAEEMETLTNGAILALPSIAPSPQPFTVHRDEQVIHEFADKRTYSAMVELVREMVANIEPSPSPPEFPEPSPEFLADADRGEESETESEESHG